MLTADGDPTDPGPKGHTMSDQDLTPDLDDTEGHLRHGRDDEAEDDTEGHLRHGRDDEAEDDTEGHIKA
jgi:hypothetical protein